MWDLNKHHRGIYTEIRPALRPDPPTEYQTLINELKETTYKSSWREVLGRSRDPIPGLPVTLNRHEFAFGKPVNWNKVSIPHLLQPFRWWGELLTGGAELYKKTHNDYEPGERLSRNYLESFDPDRRYGQTIEFNPLGVITKCALKWCDDPLLISNDVEAEYKNRGGKIDPASKIEPAGVPVPRPFHNLEDLIKDYNCDPSVLKRNLADWMARYNNFQKFVKKNPPDLRQYEAIFLFYDLNGDNLLPLERFYEISGNFGLVRLIKNIEPLLEFLKIIDDNKIDYKRFLQIMDYGLELPKIEDIPNDNKYYATSTREQFKCPDKIEKVHPYDAVRFTNEAGCLINPNIFTKYGLNNGDFKVPRSKTTIRHLFDKIGYQFDDKTFDSLWETGVNQDQTGLVCIENFYNVIKAHNV